MRLSSMIGLVMVALVGCATRSEPGPQVAPHVAAPTPAPTTDEARERSDAPPAAGSAEPGQAPVEATPMPADPLLSGQPVWETRDSGVSLSAEWRACSAPEDCQRVVTTCCDECNGGKAVSVATTHVAEVEAKHSRKGCGACTKRGCLTRATCEAGQCVMQWPKAR